MEQLKESRLDFTRFFPEVYQAVAGENYTVYAYMSDGGMRLYDAKPLIDRGGVFEPLKDKELFRRTLTVIGFTVAWDLDGTRNEETCLDIDPFEIFNSPIVDDIPAEYV